MSYLFPLPWEFFGFPSLLQSCPFWSPTMKAGGLSAGAFCDQSGDFGSGFFFLAGGDTFLGVFCGVRLCPLFLGLRGVHVLVLCGWRGGLFVVLLPLGPGASDCVTGGDNDV